MPVYEILSSENIIFQQKFYRKYKRVQVADANRFGGGLSISSSLSSKTFPLSLTDVKAIKDFDRINCMCARTCDVSVIFGLLCLKLRPAATLGCYPSVDASVSGFEPRECVQLPCF
eukprot:EG_transcript_42602